LITRDIPTKWAETYFHKTGFPTERLVCDYIEEYIAEIAEYLSGGDQMVDYFRDCALSTVFWDYQDVRRKVTGSTSDGVSPRPDFYIRCRKSSIVIEVKNPKHKPTHGQTGGIGQCLQYLDLYHANRAFLVSTIYSKYVPQTISAFDGKIGYCLVGPGAFGEVAA
jgi:hypothetical protein